MTASEITIVNTGVANTASLVGAFERCGVRAVVTHAADRIDRAALLVLPGVGTFGAVMSQLREQRLVDPLRRRIIENRPTLAICVGMQLLCMASGESPSIDGLQIVDTIVLRFPNGVRRPQFGWNRVYPTSGCTLIEPGFAYFANSYRVVDMPFGWEQVRADHGGSFVAAFERGNILGCQFHPELSGRWGTKLLQRWLTRSQECVPC